MALSALLVIPGYSKARINLAFRMSPVMAARITEAHWHIGDIVKLIEEWEAEGPPSRG